MIDAIVSTQLEHNVWATRRLLEACRALSREQWEQRFDIGPGSLAATLSHIVEAMAYFADCFAGKAYERRSDFAARASSVDGLLSLLDEAGRALDDAVESLVLRHAERGSVAWRSAPGGKLPVPVALAQVFDHGTHHRAQCLNMLKRLGVEPLPRLDPIAFGTSA